MSSVVAPALAVRGSSGIILNQGPPGYEMVSSFPKIFGKNCKAMTFSPDGQYFAWYDGLKITIIRAGTWKIVFESEKVKSAGMLFSPKGTYLVSWEHFTVNNENPNGSPNLQIWKSDDGSLVQQFIHKKQINWQPQWSKDEKICGRIVDGEVLIYEKGDFKLPKYRIHKPKVDTFTISPTTSMYHILCYMPGNTGGPSSGRLFKYPNLDTDNCIANKSFFKADRVDMYWNSKGNHVLLLTSTEVDKTGSSYYGNQSLHSMSTKGDTSIVLLNKEGPIYDISWNPNGEEFCVVYGFMPSKVALFNQKCEQIFDFGTAHRNCLYFNPYGNLLVLGGFGNINGRVEIWDAVNHRKISTFAIPDTTYLQWSPDGCHIVTATTAPRLRVGNGFKIWHYSGALLYERPWNKQEELWEVCWQTFPENVFKKPAISYKHVEGIQPSEPTASKEPYRPPAARGLPSTTKFSIHDETETAESRTPSKAVLKMKKKREMKRQAKQQQQQPEKQQQNKIIKNGHVGDVANDNVMPVKEPPAQSNEKSNKIKKIKLNLRSIEKLKELRSNGKELDKNQLEKISREQQLAKELEQLML